MIAVHAQHTPLHARIRKSRHPAFVVRGRKLLETPLLHPSGEEGVAESKAVFVVQVLVYFLLFITAHDDLRHILYVDHIHKETIHCAQRSSLRNIPH